MGTDSEADQRLHHLRQQFRQRFGQEPRVFRAPGRVNLLGEHTAHYQGASLSVAIDLDVLLAASPRDDRQVVVYSPQHDQSVEFSLDRIEFDTDQPWSNHLRGMAFFLEVEGLPLRGINGILHSEIPPGAGLGSSAATEVVTELAFEKMLGLEVGLPELGRLCLHAEAEFAGSVCSPTDWLVCRLGQVGQVLMVDSRSLQWKRLPLPDHHYLLAIADTGVQTSRLLAELEDRHQQCLQAQRILGDLLPGLVSLGELGVEEFERHRSQLPEPISRRAAYIAHENERVRQGVLAMLRNDLAEFGRLMDQSHASLRDDYQVSSPELEAMWSACRRQTGVLGSRIAGPGLGGSILSLIERSRAQEFADLVPSEYRRLTGREPGVLFTTPQQGAGELGPDPADQQIEDVG